MELEAAAVGRADAVLGQAVPLIVRQPEGGVDLPEVGLGRRQVGELRRASGIGVATYFLQIDGLMRACRSVKSDAWSPPPTDSTGDLPHRCGCSSRPHSFPDGHFVRWIPHLIIFTGA